MCPGFKRSHPQAAEKRLISDDICPPPLKETVWNCRWIIDNATKNEFTDFEIIFALDKSCMKFASLHILQLYVFVKQTRCFYSIKNI